MINIFYVNSNNQKIELMTDSVRIKEADFYQYSWKPKGSSKRYGTTVKQINKDAMTYKFTVRFKGANYDRRVNLEKFYATVEYDLINGNEGSLHYILNANSGREEDYYIKGYIVASSTSIDGNSTDLKVEFYCSDPFWIREGKRMIFGLGTDDEFLDYNHGYAYDFSDQMNASSILNTNFVGSDFRISISGPVVNPEIYIGGHLYGVDYVLESDSQHIEIDSINKTITLIDNHGTMNLFDYRNRDSYIFDLIPPGDNTVSWGSDFNWEITLIEKRSEPKWT